MKYNAMRDKVAKAIIEHIPSNPLHDPSDPTGLKWATSISESAAEAAIRAIQDEMPEASDCGLPTQDLFINSKAYNELKELGRHDD